MRNIIILSFLIISGCANPLNRVTSDNYAEECSIAEDKGNLIVAEEACYRAMVNVDWGNLGDQLKSERTYNLARIKRRLAKFNEAEHLLKQSLEIEERLSGPSSTKIGRRLAELSINLAAQDKWTDGTPMVERLITMADQYSGHERSFIKEILQEYSKQLHSKGNHETANLFSTKANQL